jgi:hypothetical protein
MGKDDKELQDWLAHWRELLRVAEDDLEALISGQRQMGENRGDGWVDMTAKWTERLRSEVAAIGNLIAAYEKAEIIDYSSPSHDDPLVDRDVFPE